MLSSPAVSRVIIVLNSVQRLLFLNEIRERRLKDFESYEAEYETPTQRRAFVQISSFYL